MPEERIPHLTAYRDDTLSTEAAEELVRLSGDASIPAHVGEELPMANKAVLLRKIRASIPNRSSDAFPGDRG